MTPAIARRAVCVAVLALAAAPVAAQTPFGEIRISGGPSRMLQHAYLHEVWTPETGASIRIETPFQVGYLEIGARFDRYTPAQPEVPDFDAVLVHAGWGLAWRPLPWLRLSGGGRVGSMAMRFDDRLDPWGRSESELTLAGVGRLEIVPVSFAGLFVETGYGRTFTRERLNLSYASAGLLMRFRTPEWLRRILE